MAPYASGERHIVMGGAPRSGTTVLRKVFDRHPGDLLRRRDQAVRAGGLQPRVARGVVRHPHAELTALRAGADSQAAFIDAFAARVRADAGKVRWAEKTPQNIRHLESITARFPQASIIHIIRDGRDVICSMRTHPDWRWVDGSWQKVLVPRSLESYARRWLADTAAGLAWRDDPRYVEVRYEDLVADPPTVLRSICDGIGAGHDAQWLAQVGPAEDAAAADAGQTKRPDYEGAVSAASVGRWRTHLSPDEQAEVERLCGPRLRELGYER